MNEIEDSYMTRAVYFTNYPLKHPDAWRKSRSNTSVCCRLAVERCKKLGIQQIVIASDTGFSALKLMEEVERQELRDVAIVVEAGMYGEVAPNRTGFQEESLKKLENLGAKNIVFVGGHTNPGGCMGQSAKSEWNN